jgi:hypothetical protein
MLLTSITVHVVLVIFYVLQLCNLSVPFCLQYENVIVKVCNGLFDCSFVFETWFLILRKKRRLRAFNNRVMGKLGPNREGVRGRWMKLHNS